MMANNSYLLISSKNRDRILYPNPSEFKINIRDNRRFSTSRETILQADNPVSEQLPVYNFCFSTFDNNSTAFLTSITSMDGEKITLNENITTLFNRQIHPIVNLTHTLEQEKNVLQNLNIEVEIADSIFTRKIKSYNPIDNSIIVDIPFPLMSTNNTTTELSCKITVTSSTTEQIICNGSFLSNNNFYYQNKNKFLYNISENIISEVNISSNGQEFVFSDSTSNPQNNNTNQQYMLMYSDRAPTNYGKLIEQVNAKYYSFQFGASMITKNGRNYQNNDIVMLYSSSSDTNSNESDGYFHKYKIINMRSTGEFNNNKLDDNLQLVSLGSQELQTGVAYSIVKDLQDIDNDDTAVCSLKSLNLTFQVSLNKNYTKLENHFFYPIVLSNQYDTSTNTNGDNIFEIHPNNALLNQYDGNKPQTLLDHQAQNGVAVILKSGELINDADENNNYYYIQTQTFKTNTQDRLDLLQTLLSSQTSNDPLPPFLNGIDNFLILEYTDDSVCTLDCKEYSSTSSTKNCISLRNLVLPNKRLKNFGCNVIDLPYVLIEVETNNTSTSNQKTIQSNSPHIKNKCQFFIPMDGINCCSSMNQDGFITIYSDSIQSPIDFPSYNYLQFLSFKILSPNGEILEFEEDEYTLPFNSNEALNITLFLEVSER